MADDDRLGRMEADLGGLKTDVSSLKTDVSTLKTDVESVKVGIHKLDILHDETRALIRVIAERLDATPTRDEMNRGFAELGARIDANTAIVETFVREQVQLNRKVTTTLDDHERRLGGLERRRGR